MDLFASLLFITTKFVTERFPNNLQTIQPIDLIYLGNKLATSCTNTIITMFTFNSVNIGERVKGDSPLTRTTLIW